MMIIKWKKLSCVCPPLAGKVDSIKINLRRRRMEFQKDDLIEAKRQIDSTLHKLKETINTLEAKENTERYKSQITLAKRRVKAFEIANCLIESELAKN